MNKQDFQAELAFQISAQILRIMRVQGLITDKEYRTVVKQLISDIHPFTGDIYT